LILHRELHLPAKLGLTPALNVSAPRISASGQTFIRRATLQHFVVARAQMNLQKRLTGHQIANLDSTMVGEFGWRRRPAAPFEQRLLALLV
jgi:hypothetical protein